LRYEKVFRRLDVDGDGSITVKEFKAGLRRMRCQNEKKWTFRMIRRFFDDCDKNGDGLLSLKEFSGVIKIWKAGDASVKEEKEPKKELPDEDETDAIFRKGTVILDADLFKKVLYILITPLPYLLH
jgi:Ca2+-binding EF-hand superfamily protein